MHSFLVVYHHVPDTLMVQILHSAHASTVFDGNSIFLFTMLAFTTLYLSFLHGFLSLCIREADF